MTEDVELRDIHLKYTTLMTKEINHTIYNRSRKNGYIEYNWRFKLCNLVNATVY